MCWVTLFYPYSPNIRLRKDKSSQQYLKKICRTLSNILAYADIMDELHTGFRIAESSLKSQPPSYQSADIKDLMFFKRNCFFFSTNWGRVCSRISWFRKLSSKETQATIPRTGITPLEMMDIGMAVFVISNS